MEPQGRKGQALQTPRAAGLAGVVFAVLLAAAIILIRLAIPEDEGAVTAEGFNDSSRRNAVRTALALVPFAGIFFLWFVGVLRSHVGEAEDKFVATVFLGSGLIFVASLFGAAAAAAGVLSVGVPSGNDPGLPSWDFGRHFAYTMLTDYTMRMAAVFTLTTSTLGHRLGVFPRWLTLLGLLVALALLFVAPDIAWAELVFPAWSLIVSGYILVVGGTTRPDAADAS
ncbi:hypothetical protein OHA79_40015 [Streptomyces sp. NBC_00841]|uniref:hypothetical protein n=1 Tax=Streptomyces sp. NBC_00841 TaxID=2975847 RepID=UPI002DDA0374|nr:hypothetical protein [Streptomyces sp. NBC_00841]WSA03465.1 hypothetical protein OHA79_40015 [Streptomyces sp. NBC_00841]